MKVKEVLSKNNSSDISEIIEYDKKERIVEYVLGMTKEQLILNLDLELSDEQVSTIEKFFYEISQGKPLQYITHKQYFYKSEFYVDERVLIPQPDTEVLVEKAIEILRGKADCKVLDLCTGSGAIAISIKKELPNVKMYASDISKSALEVAKINSENILGKDKIIFIESDLFDNIENEDIKLNEFDLIVSNPPYIKKSVIKELDKEVQSEPIIALDGGEDGLDFYRKIANIAEEKKIKHMLLEIGYDQGKDILDIFKNATIYKDYAGNDRVVECRKD